MKKWIHAWLVVCCLTACRPFGNGIKTLDVDAFEQKLRSSEVQLVDVRRADEYAEGHLAGSINIDVSRDDFVANATEKLDKSKPVAVYCRSGKRSLNAASILSGNGFRIIYNLKSGYLSWIDAGKANE